MPKVKKGDSKLFDRSQDQLSLSQDGNSFTIRRLNQENEVKKMRSKTPLNTLNLLIAALLVSATLSGCARDGAISPVDNAFEYASPYAEVERNLEQASGATIQQTAYESAVVDPVWHDSLSTAIAEAKSNNKLILANFTGSDWCHFCVKLKDEVFKTPDFKAWASDNVVLLEVDFPKRTQLPPEVQRQNDMLQSRFNISSYPTVLLLDAGGNVRAKMGYERGKSSSQWVQLAEARLQQNVGNANPVAHGQSSTKLR